LKRNKIYILICIALTIFVTSCNKISPAGFWTEFHKDLIIKKYSDQGPWGGHREIEWKSETTNCFTDKELIGFGHMNDWELIDSISFSLDTLSQSSFSQLKNDDYSQDILNQSILPKLNLNDSKVFVFRTTWLDVEPGNARETFENGFAVLNSDRTELKIYHSWGD